MPAEGLSSPSTATRKGLSHLVEVPLDDPRRQRPIHAQLDQIKLPAGDAPASHYHPVTCDLLTAEELQSHNFQSVQKQFPTREDAWKALQETVKAVAAQIHESAKKTQEIDKEKADKLKMREVERKVYQNMKQSKNASGKP